MDPQRYARIKEIFREALRWAPDERAAVVATLAEGDDAVRDEVLSLLAHHDDAPLIREPAPNLLRAGGPPPAEATAPRGSRTGDEAPAVEAMPPPRDSHGGPSSAPATDPSAASEEVVARQTLAERLRGERAGGAAAGWPLDRVIRTLDPVARALASAADRGGVHGALRAAHILVAEVDGDLVAELAGPGQLPPTSGPPGGQAARQAAGQIDGADAAAAAPEQLLPALGPTGPWTDVYALALLCVELMLGRPAVESSASAALARTRDEVAQPTPRAVGLEVPAAVEEVMRIALAMRPMERYQQVRRFWTALRDSLAASSPAPAPHPPPPASGPGRPATRSAFARRSTAVIVTLVAAAGLVATVVILSCC